RLAEADVAGAPPGRADAELEADGRDDLVGVGERLVDHPGPHRRGRDEPDAGDRRARGTWRSSACTCCSRATLAGVSTAAASGRAARGWRSAARLALRPRRAASRCCT